MFEVIFIMSQPLNFLGYARTQVEREHAPFLWSSSVEQMFARDSPLDSVFLQVPDEVKEATEPHRNSFMRLWPSFYEELLPFRERLERIWKSHCNTVVDLMDKLGFYYPHPVEVFPVMPFFWVIRSTPLSIPANSYTDGEILEFLVHEILHKTTTVHSHKSLWHHLSMVFSMKKVTTEKRFSIQHALIFVASSWIVSETVKEEFVIPEPAVEGSEIEHYVRSVFNVFSSPFEKKNSIEFAEKIIASCTL